MINNDLKNEYFDWMYDLVCDERWSKDSTYRKLFVRLYDTEFTYTVPMDGNRFEDGVNLRYRFGREHGIDERQIATYLDDRPCSVLEMMLALAIRCEENIMDNPDVGNRVGQWFWEMIVNLRLGNMKDDAFDPHYVDERLDIFLERRYGRDGSGGALFRITDPSRDLRTAELWYQMCWYLSELFSNDD